MQRLLLTLLLMASVTFAGGRETLSGGQLTKLPSGFKLDTSKKGGNEGTFSFFDFYTEEENQEWSSDFNDWVTVSKEITIYDSTAKTITLIEQELTAGQLTNDSKSVMFVEINMSDSTFKFTKMESYSWTGSDWELQGRTTYEFDTNGFLIKSTMEFQLGPGMFLPVLRTTYTNNAAGNPELMISESYNMGTQQWENTGKTELTYKKGDMNYLESETDFDWEENEWRTNYKSIYTRNAQLNPVEVLYQDNISGTLVNTGREVITYLADGEREDSNYYYYWDQINSDWRPSSLFIYTYNAAGDEDVIYFKDWEITSWVDNSKITLTYDGERREIIELTENWVDNAWVNYYRILSSYTPVSVEDDAKPASFTLKNNYPNPFNPSTTIEYEVKNAGMVTLTVYNVLGQIVAVLQNGYQQAGVYTVQFDATGLTSGVYLYELSAGNTKVTKKMILNK